MAAMDIEQLDKQQFCLDLTGRKGLLAGGESGPAMVPRKPNESLLIEAVRRESLEMPPEEELSADQINVLTSWIKAGAGCHHWRLRSRRRSVGDERRGLADDR